MAIDMEELLEEKRKPKNEQKESVRGIPLHINNPKKDNGDKEGSNGSKSLTDKFWGVAGKVGNKIIDIGENVAENQRIEKEKNGGSGVSDYFQNILNNSDLDLVDIGQNNKSNGDKKSKKKKSSKRKKNRKKSSVKKKQNKEKTKETVIEVNGAKIKIS